MALKPASGLGLGSVQRQVRMRRRTWAAAAAVAVAASVLVVSGMLPLASRDVASQSAPERGWASAAQPPLVPRLVSTAVAVGGEVFVWGGEEPSAAAPGPGDSGSALGAVYRISGDSWRLTAPAPFESGPNDVTVSVGNKVFLWSFALRRAALYDPSTDEWVLLPQPALRGGGAPVVAGVWTGEEVVLWGGRDHAPERPAFGAAFSPLRGTWRTIAAAPIESRQWHTATWTGREMVIMGGTTLTSVDNRGLAVGAYDPQTDTWRELPDPPVHIPQWHSAVVASGQLVAVGGMELQPVARALSFDLKAETWEILPEMPMGARSRPIAVAVGDGVFVWGGEGPDGAASDGAVLHAEEATWEWLPRVEGIAACGAAGAPVGDAVFLWGGDSAECAKVRAGQAALFRN